MFHKGRKIIKSFSMPNWFEAELIRAINILIKDLKISDTITTLKNNGLKTFLEIMFKNLNEKKISSSKVITVKTAISAIQEFLWLRLQIIMGDELANTSSLRADYDKQLIYVLEDEINSETKELVDIINQIADKTGSKDLKKIVDLARQGKAEIKVHKLSLDKKNIPLVQPPILPDTPINAEGEEKSMDNLEEFFKNQDKGKLNKPEK